MSKGTGKFKTSDLRKISSAPDPAPKQKGDIVRLNSGSPLMLVEAVLDNGKVLLKCKDEHRVLPYQCVYRVARKN